MKIKMIESVGSSQYDLQIGTVVDLPDKVAQELIDKGFAILPDKNVNDITENISKASFNPPPKKKFTSKK